MGMWGIPRGYWDPMEMWGPNVNVETPWGCGETRWGCGYTQGDVGIPRRCGGTPWRCGDPMGMWGPDGDVGQIPQHGGAGTHLWVQGNRGARTGSVLDLLFTPSRGACGRGFGVGLSGQFWV